MGVLSVALCVLSGHREVSQHVSMSFFFLITVWSSLWSYS